MHLSKGEALGGFWTSSAPTTQPQRLTDHLDSKHTSLETACIATETQARMYVPGIFSRMKTQRRHHVVPEEDEHLYRDAKGKGPYTREKMRPRRSRKHEMYNKGYIDSPQRSRSRDRKHNHKHRSDRDKHKARARLIDHGDKHKHKHRSHCHRDEETRAPRSRERGHKHKHRSRRHKHKHSLERGRSRGRGRPVRRD